MTHNHQPETKWQETRSALIALCFAPLVLVAVGVLYLIAVMDKQR